MVQYAAITAAEISSGRPDTPRPSHGMCSIEPWFYIRSTHACSVCVRALRAGIQIQSRGGFRGTCGENCQWMGFRRDWKIRSIYPPSPPIASSTSSSSTSSSSSSFSSSPFDFSPYSPFDFSRNWRLTTLRDAKR